MHWQLDSKDEETMLLHGWYLGACVLLTQLPPIAVDDPTADPIAVEQEVPTVETEPEPPSTLVDDAPLEADTHEIPARPSGPNPASPGILSTQPTEVAEPATNPDDAENPMVAVDRTRRQSLPELLSQAMTAAAASGLPGRPISLIEALAAIKNHDTDSRRQLIRAYWQLATAMLDYQFRQTELRTLGRLANDTVNALVKSTPVELTATLEETKKAETAGRDKVTNAQRELAALLTMPLAREAILASDAPHAGPYRTRFEQLFQGRQAPSQSLLLNRILPLRHDEIESRGRAIAAAEYAVAASAEQYRAGQATVSQLMHDLALLASIRRTLVTALEQYNDEIADYVLAARFSSSDQALVAMLIKPRVAQSIARNGPPGGTRTRDLVRANVDGVERTGFDAATPKQPGLPTAEEPDPQPPTDAGESLPGSKDERPPAVPPSEPAHDATLALLADTQVYQGLAGMEPNRQAQQLVSALYLHHHSTGIEQSLTLLEVLQTPIANGSLRLGLIANYWQACELAARQHVLDNAVVQLKSLKPIALAARAEPNGAGQMLVLDAAIAAAEADYLATEIALASEQWRLMVGLGRPLDQPWLLPVTAPHAGRYRTKIDLAHGPARLREVAGQINELHRHLVQGTNSIIELDEARSAAMASYATTRQDLRTALADTARELNETLILLSSVTRYNSAIADFALGVLPQNTPAPLVISTLIHVRPNAGREG